MESPTAKLSSRIYYMDLARAVILVSGVFFHAALLFSAPDWFIVPTWRSPVLGSFVTFCRGFRMETLFIVSGFFSAVLVTRRGSRGFVLNRMVRMGVPLLFCGLVFNSIVALQSDVRIIPWRDAHYFIHGDWKMHLWNVGNLLAYEGTMFTALWICPSFHARLATIRIRVPVAILAYLSVLLAMRWIWSLLPEVPGANILFYTEMLPAYAPAYLLGYTVHQNERLREGLFDWKFASIFTLVLFGVRHWVAEFLPKPGLVLEIHGLDILQHLARPLLVFSIVKLLETKNSWVKRISIASYTIYILHLPVQTAMYRVFPPLQHGYAAFFILSVVSLGLTWAFHVLVVERRNWAGFLFNGKIYDEKTRSW